MEGARASEAAAYYQVESASIISTETQVSIDSKAFTVYRVEVVPVAAAPWVVARRFSEFSDLRAALAVIDKKGRQLLVKQPFPPRHLYGSMQEEVVAARLATLQAWLAEAVRHYRNAVPLLTFLSDDGSENSAVDLLGAKSYLRGVELRLEKPMNGWGSRTPKEKSCYLLATKAGAVVTGPKRQVLTMLTLGSPPLPAPCPVPISSKSSRGHMRSFLVDIEHPFLMPVVDVGFQPENEKVLVFREFASRGSLKDLVHKAKTPCAGADEKYAGASAVKRRAGLNEKKVALYGRQVLEGMRYLEELGLDCSFLTCANVLVYENEWCRISDFENALVGLPVLSWSGSGAGSVSEPPAGAGGQGQQQREDAAAAAGEGTGAAAAAHLAAPIVFGRLLHALATGVEMPIGIGGSAGEAFTMPACPIQIQRVLDIIFNVDESGVEGARMAGGAGGGGDSVEALLALPFFNSVELHPRQQEATTPPIEKTKKLKKRLAKSLAPPKEKDREERRRSKRELIRAGAPQTEDGATDTAPATAPPLENRPTPAQAAEVVPEPEPELVPAPAPAPAAAAPGGLLAEIR